MRVLVTGGAGYIGSHTVLALAAAGHSPVIADNFSNSSPAIVNRLSALSGISIDIHEADLVNEEATDALFSGNNFDAVIHCAGLKAVGESVRAPLHYYRNNLDTTLSLLTAIKKHNVNRIVFSSSATVYGATHKSPFSEDLWPLESSNPYGQTKVMIERIIMDVAASIPTLKVAILRYFNPVGAHESGEIGEDPRGIPNNLMPYIAQVAVGRLSELTVHGGDYETADGTGERDYIHVLDLAEGHVSALDHLDFMDDRVRAFNLGTGHPTSVLSLIRAFEQVSGRAVPYSVGPRRPGDLATAYANPARAHIELGWKASRSILEMCSDTWRWQLSNPNGLSSPIGE